LQSVIDSSLIQTSLSNFKEINKSLLTNPRNFVFSPQTINESLYNSKRLNHVNIFKTISLHQIDYCLQNSPKFIEAHNNELANKPKSEETQRLQKFIDTANEFANRLKNAIENTTNLDHLTVNVKTMENNEYETLYIHEVFNRIINGEKLVFDKSYYQDKTKQVTKENLPSDDTLPKFENTTELMKKKELPGEIAEIISKFAISKPAQILSNFQNKLEAIELEMKANNNDRKSKSNNNDQKQKSMGNYSI
jgi:hypothetical protein